MRSTGATYAHQRLGASPRAEVGGSERVLGAIVGRLGGDSRDTGIEQLTTAREMVAASAIGEEALVADAMEIVREDVQQKAADELIGCDRHHLVFPSAQAAEIGQHAARNRDGYHSSWSLAPC